MKMSFYGKISNTIGALCVAGSVLSLTVLIALLMTVGSVWQCVAASMVLLIFGALLYIWLLTAPKNKPNADVEPIEEEEKPQPAPQPVENNGATIQKLSNHIRTPLNNILGVANLMSENFNPDNKKQYVDSLIASVETITDIVDIINGESGGRPFGIDVNDGVRTFDLRNLITQTAELTPGVEVKLEVYGELPRLKGNSVKMRRIMLSIFDFFLQYTPKESLPAQVTIVVNRVRIPIKPIKYRFDVKSDFGIPGLADAEITELNIAKRLIEELGGNIKRRFEDDSTFIYFNVCFDDEEEATEAPAPQSRVEVYTNETAGFTTVARTKSPNEADIIVCDDNPINQKVMSLSLDKHVRSIALASNGQECVDLVASGRYDVILMDIQMPVLDGYQATIQIRDAEKKSDVYVPIIAVTANTMSGDRQHCLEIGMDDYISKPFQIEDVLRKMGEQLVKHPVK
jgi:CheY-like chemotaxis protein